MSWWSLKCVLLVHTWYSKSTEAHCQHQEGDGHSFAVGISYHQQQSGFHAKSYHRQTAGHTHTHTNTPSPQAVGHHGANWIKHDTLSALNYVSDRYEINAQSQSASQLVCKYWTDRFSQKYKHNQLFKPSGCKEQPKREQYGSDTLWLFRERCGKWYFILGADFSPPQFMIFLTVVVDRMFLLRRKSASWPPMGTMMVITKCGSADRMPTCKQRQEINHQLQCDIGVGHNIDAAIYRRQDSWDMITEMLVQNIDILIKIIQHCKQISLQIWPTSITSGLRHECW